MAKRSREELLATIQAYVGDRTDDETMRLIEDVTDSFDSDTEDWKAKYEENDRSWRQKYRDRFFNNDAGTQEMKQESREESTDVVEDITEESVTIDELFND